MCVCASACRRPVISPNKKAHATRCEYQVALAALIRAFKTSNTKSAAKVQQIFELCKKKVQKSAFLMHFSLK